MFSFRALRLIVATTGSDFGPMFLAARLFREGGPRHATDNRARRR